MILHLKTDFVFLEVVAAQEHMLPGVLLHGPLPGERRGHGLV